MYKNFTEQANRILFIANRQAAEANHEYINSEHILGALAEMPDTTASYALRNLGVQPSDILQDLAKIFQTGSCPAGAQELKHTKRTDRVVTYAMEEARGMECDRVDVEHILLGLIREQAGVGAKILANRGITLDAARNEIMYLQGKRQRPVMPSCNAYHFPVDGENRADQIMEIVKLLEGQIDISGVIVMGRKKA